MIAMPGGFGTLDELFEALTWSQLDYHRKLCGLLNVAGYYDHLIAWVPTFRRRWTGQGGQSRPAGAR